MEVEVEGADVVGAAGAGELHASLDAGDGVVSLHNSSVVLSRGSDRHEGRGGEGNEGDEGVLTCGRNAEVGRQNAEGRMQK